MSRSSTDNNNNKENLIGMVVVPKPHFGFQNSSPRYFGIRDANKHNRYVLNTDHAHYSGLVKCKVN